MRHVGMEPFLPKHYILKRWTRDANASTKKDLKDRCFDDNNLESVKRTALIKRMDTIMSTPIVLTTALDWACGKLDKMLVSLADLTEASGEDEPTKPNLTSIKREDDDLKFSDPPVSQCKGSRIPQQFKAPADIRDAKKMRTCSYCHKKEGHNMRNCPKKKEDDKARQRGETISIQNDKRKRKEPISIEDASESESEFMTEDDEDGEDDAYESDTVYGDEEDLF
ncbi:uncharacterized protein LOC144559700 [Carex rostrata]